MSSKKSFLLNAENIYNDVIVPSSLLTSSCPATIVTAYFNIKSKASHPVYLQRMQNCLSLQDCMVIFTSPDMAGWVHQSKI